MGGASVVIDEILFIILSVGNLPIGGESTQTIRIESGRRKRRSRGVERGDVGGGGILWLNETLFVVSTGRI